MRETKNIMAGSSSLSKLHITSTINTQMNLALLLFLSRLGAIGKVAKSSANLLQHMVLMRAVSMSKTNIKLELLFILRSGVKT